MIKPKKVRSKKCKVCSADFVPFKMGQVCCGVSCAVQYARISVEKDKVKKQRARDKAERAKIRSVRKALRENDRSYWLKKAQDKVNKFIRLRDQGLPCIACGCEWKPNFQASHYVPQGRSAFLRFNEDNIHSGCIKCNLFESGNLRMYRIGLIRKIGVSGVEWLENNARTIKKWNIDELKVMVKEYEQKIKSIECEM